MPDNEIDWSADWTVCERIETVALDRRTTDAVGIVRDMVDEISGDYADTR